MGGGSFSYMDRQSRAVDRGYYSQPVERVLSRSMHPEMDPRKALLRESRDSDEHPESLAIIITLDMTGSMLSVPQEMVRDGLPKIVSGLMEAGIQHPQILFLGVGDLVDDAPLQVGQFESSDALLDKWLTQVWPEKGGGGNYGEDYELAWMFAADRTSIDCFEKRGQKGFLFTIGDEPVHEDFSPRRIVEKLGGEVSYKNSKEMLEAARKKYEVFHINLTETGTDARYESGKHWKDFIGENLITVHSHEQIPEIIYKTVVNTIKNSKPTAKVEIKEESMEEVLTEEKSKPSKKIL